MKEARQDRWWRKASRTWRRSRTERDRWVGIPRGVVDAACRCRDEGSGPHGRRSSADRLGREVQPGTKGSAQAAALKEAESPEEDETSSKDGADGGRRETAWARVKIRGRGGSGEPNVPAIRTAQEDSTGHRTSGGSAGRGNPRAAQRQARLEPPKGGEV